MRYEDFTVQLTPGAAGGYAARVVNSPAGQAEGTFAIPIRHEELAEWTAEVTRAAERNLSPEVAPLAAEPPSRDLGDRLFRALFSGPLKSRLDESLGLLGEERGLRLRLQMSLDDPALARLQALPWEFLFRAERGAFLGLGSRIVVVRSPSLPLGGERPPARRPLRLLALVCAPPGLPPLDLARESESLRSLCGTGLAEVEFLNQPTLDDLRHALRARRPHILHVMGHGAFDARNGRGSLFLTGEDGQAEPVDGELLADHLRDCPSLLLVFLNACQTARLAAPNPFAGMAAALLQAGVPSVLAMQFPVRDDAAIAFSGELYRQLVQGEPIETAVAEGRLAIRRRLPETMEWGTPVLFLRSSDGHLFREEAPSKPEPPQPSLPIPASPRTPSSGAVWLSVILAGSLALGLGLKEWPFSTPEDPRQTVPMGTEAKIIGTTLPSLQPTEPPKTVVEPLPSTPKGPPEGSPKPTSHHKTDTPISGGGSPPPIASHPGVYKVTMAAPVYLSEARAELSAQFLDAFGQPAYRLSFSPRSGAFAQSPPALGGDSFAFDTATGKVWIDVLSIDWERQTLTVRSRLETG